MNPKLQIHDHAPIKRRLSSARDLHDYELISDSDLKNVQETEKHFAVGLSDHLVQTIYDTNHSDAIKKQYIPNNAELSTTPDELYDPIGDKEHEPVKGIVHRYPDRALFKIANACAVYCRYCFRREMIGAGTDVLNADDVNNALDYIRKTPEIWEVILTGGDPFILSSNQMQKTLSALNDIDHVRTVRIHTRVPIADPKRINEKFLEALAAFDKPLYVVVHINHSDEITQDVKDMIKKLYAADCTLLSQSVLLRGINDNAEILENLFRELICINIKPYYLHHPDKAKGTSHFRLPLKRGMAIYQSLLGRISGICQPSYMLDIPSGHGKIPINHSYVEELDKGRYNIRDYQGNIHEYKDDE